MGAVGQQSIAWNDHHQTHEQVALESCKQCLHNGVCDFSAPQSHLECRLWNEIFVESQRLLGIPNGEGPPAVQLKAR